MAVLESLAAGLPAVITHDTGISDKLEANGAALVTSGDPDDLAAAVVGLLAGAEQWKRVASAARRLAASEFSTRTLAERLTREYAKATLAHSSTRSREKG
jgi:glycosyltransferase involved in cell wall biosynthesis